MYVCHSIYFRTRFEGGKPLGKRKPERENNAPCQDSSIFLMLRAFFIPVAGIHENISWKESGKESESRRLGAREGKVMG